MKQITLEELLAAGCHFGHQVTRSNPKARDFVFESRDNIQIIDLGKTKQGLDEAAEFVKSIGLSGGKLLVIGTKKQAKQIIEEEVSRARTAINSTGAENLFYITRRWVGGILTNFSEVSKNFKKLEDLKSKLEDPEEKAKFTKKEIGEWDKERQRLESFYKGIVTMQQKPDALFIVDSHMEYLAVNEARSTNVKTVAIVDTNADPFVIDYPIPANDDAVGSIKLIVAQIMDAFIEGVKAQKPAKPEVKEEPTKKESSASQENSESSEIARKVSGDKKIATIETQKGNETLKTKKIATTETQKGNETLKTKKIATIETQKGNETLKTKKIATTETQKGNETLKTKKIATIETQKGNETLKTKKIATTETQNKTEAQKQKKSSVVKKTSVNSVVAKNGSKK